MPRPPDKPDAPVVYRDGLGRPIPNEDERLRQAAQQALLRRFTRRVRCENQGRSGRVVVEDGERRITFWHEMGGGGCKWFIDVPPPHDWETRTGVPLAERDELLQFVAENVQRQQCPGWRFRIGVDSISFHADDDG